VVPGCAQGADDSQSVKAGKHPVDDQGVIVRAGGHEQPLPAVIRVIDDRTDLAEGLLQVGRHLGVVFDQQHTHLRFAVRSVGQNW